MVVAAVVAGTVVSAGVAGASAASSAKAARANMTAAERAANLQAEAAERQAEIAQENLDFQKQQYEDWESVYGPVRENLSDFYQDLTPDIYIASGLAQIDQQYEATLLEFDRQFAQRGIDSPAQDSLQLQVGLNAATQKAVVRQRAPLTVADVQQGFLSNNVSNPNTQGISNAFQNQANVYGEQAGVYGNQANAFRAQAARDQAAYEQSIAAIGTSVGNGITAGIGLSGTSTTGAPPTTTSPGNLPTYNPAGGNYTPGRAIVPIWRR